MELEARERHLSELPVAVLRAHAQECGIDVSSALEKNELVRQIMRNEPGDLGQSNRSTHAPSSQSQVDMQADENFARRLQAEEAASARRQQQEMMSLRAGGGGGGTPGDALFGLLSQALQGQHRHEEARERGAPLQTGGSGGYVDMMEAIRQMGPAGPQHPSDISPGGAPSSPTRPRMRGASGSPGNEDSGADHNSPDGDVARQALLGLLSQVLANPDGRLDRNNVAGMHVLTELLNSFQQQQGIDAAAVEGRTAEMTFAESPDRHSATDATSPARNETEANSEERKCMVCLEEFKAGDKLRILPCLHRYHTDCIVEWLRRNRHCPVCKHDVTQ
jgi:hypothetical protein